MNISTTLNMSKAIFRLSILVSILFLISSCANDEHKTEEITTVEYQCPM